MENMRTIQFFFVLFFMLTLDMSRGVIPNHLYSTLEAASLSDAARTRIMKDAASRFIAHIEGGGEWVDFRTKALADYSNEWGTLCLIVWEAPESNGFRRFCTAQKCFNTASRTEHMTYTVRLSYTRRRYDLPVNVLKCDCWYSSARDINNHPLERITFFITSFSDTEYLKLVPYSEIIPNTSVNEYVLAIADFMNTSPIQ